MAGCWRDDWREWCVSPHSVLMHDIGIGRGLQAVQERSGAVDANDEAGGTRARGWLRRCVTTTGEASQPIAIPPSSHRGVIALRPTNHHSIAPRQQLRLLLINLAIPSPVTYKLTRSCNTSLHRQQRSIQRTKDAHIATAKPIDYRNTSHASTTPHSSPPLAHSTPYLTKSSLYLRAPQGTHTFPHALPPSSRRSSPGFASRAFKHAVPCEVTARCTSASLPETISQSIGPSRDDL